KSLGPTQHCAVGLERRRMDAGALALDALTQGGVTEKLVVVLEVGDLVVRLEGAHRLVIHRHGRLRRDPPGAAGRLIPVYPRSPAAAIAAPRPGRLKSDGTPGSGRRAHPFIHTHGEPSCRSGP